MDLALTPRFESSNPLGLVSLFLAILYIGFYIVSSQSIRAMISDFKHIVILELSPTFDEFSGLY